MHGSYQCRAHSRQRLSLPPTPKYQPQHGTGVGHRDHGRQLRLHRQGRPLGPVRLCLSRARATTIGQRPDATAVIDFALNPPIQHPTHTPKQPTSSVFDNIRKFLQFQLTVNVVALTITFLSAVSVRASRGGNDTHTRVFVCVCVIYINVCVCDVYLCRCLQSPTSDHARTHARPPN